MVRQMDYQRQMHLLIFDLDLILVVMMLLVLVVQMTLQVQYTPDYLNQTRCCYY
jgi:hypothetical protein